MDFLFCEHMNHNGLENGFLYATYDQLQAWGIGRRHIHAAITEAERRGLIEVHRGGRKGFAQTHLTRFRITFLKSKAADEFGKTYYKTATNEWRRYRERMAENRNDGSEGELSQCTKVNYHSARRETVETPEPAEIRAAPTVHEGKPLIYSGPDQQDLAASSPSSTTPTTAEQDNSSGMAAGRQHPTVVTDKPAPSSAPKSAPAKPSRRAAAASPIQTELEDAIVSSGGQDLRPAVIDLEQLRADVQAWLDKLEAMGFGRGGKTRLAKLSGLNRATVSNFLRGEHGLSTEAAGRLAEALEQAPIPDAA
jgi:hypothetical protein